MSKLVFKPGEIQQATVVKQVDLPAKYQKNLIDTDEYHEFEMDEEARANLDLCFSKEEGSSDRRKEWLALE